MQTALLWLKIEIAVLKHLTISFSFDMYTLPTQYNTFVIAI